MVLSRSTSHQRSEERAEPIRQMLGVTSAEDQLVAALQAREWLQRLAGDLEAAQHD